MSLGNFVMLGLIVMLHLDISSAAPSPKTYLVETADESMAPGKGDDYKRNFNKKWGRVRPRDKLKLLQKGDDYAYSGNFLWKHGGPVTLDSKELELLNQERLRDSAGLSEELEQEGLRDDAGLREELEQGDDYSNRWNSMLHSMGDDYRRELAQEVVRPPYWW